MATPTDIGIDVKGIAAPLVDTAFGLAGSALVIAALTLGGTKRVVDPTTDQATDTGGYSASVSALLYSRDETDIGDPLALREAMLLVNASDLVAAGIPDTVRPRTNDKALINGNTWTVIGIMPIPTDVIYLLRIRR